MLLYKKDILNDPQLPSEEHLNYIIAGAQSQGLPPAYLETLRKMESRKANFAVPKKSKFDLSILFDRCSNCGDADIAPAGVLEQKKIAVSVS